MSISNREAFLDNVASKLGRSRRRKDVVRPNWSVQPQWNVFEGYTEEELVNVLEEQCDLIHTDFKRTSRENLSEALKETIDNYEGKKIIISNDERNSMYGLDLFYRQLQKDEIEVHQWDPKEGKNNQVIAERADIGITFSDITLAESGTVTLFNDKNNGRSISLLPRTYIAIIPIQTLVPRMTQAVKQIHEMNQRGEIVPSCVSFISGPSNSADIEMSLIVGVHGPIQATYILVDEG